MAIGSYLIHSGLPWSAPQKIIISSAQYINNIVINRGLLNLLNNDYYLDIKTQALNNYIQQNLGKHLSNTDIHVSWSRITSLFGSVKIATKDSVYYIPLTWNGKVQSYSDIQTMIDLMPRNLNGHSIVIYLCHGYDEQSPKISNQIDLEYSCLDFTGFSGGDVVIYGSADKIKLKGYKDLDTLQASQLQSTGKFEQIQQRLLNKTGFNKSNNITIASTGLNRNYATIAIKNCTANMYLLNVGVKNTIDDWDDIQSYKSSIKKFPPKQNVLNYYSLIDNNGYTIANNNEYLNSDFLYQSSDYSLYFSKTDSQNIVTSSKYDDEDIVYASINNNTQNMTTPDYFCFDSQELSQGCIISNQLRNYIYNWNGQTSGFTITFFGHLNNDDSNFSNCPILSDYDVAAGNPSNGLYVYLNKLYRAASSTIDVAEYDTNFEKYYSTLTKDNSWGLYVLQFVHTNKALSNDTTINPSLFGSLATKYSQAPIATGKMRVNLSFYQYGTNNIDILIPNTNTLQNIKNMTDATSEDISNYFRKIGYEINTIPEEYFNNYQYPIRLFANKKYNSQNLTLRNWDYFSGNVKNLLLFNTILTQDQIKAMLQAGFSTNFNWMSKSQLDLINSITTSSYIGAIYLYNSHNVNIIGNNIQG